MQLAAAQVGVPADEGITRGQRQGRGGEAQRAQHAVVGNQQVAQLGAHVPGRAARMLALQQLGPDPPLVLPADLDQRQPLDEVGPRGHVRRGGHGPTETARLAGPAPVAGRGQLDAAVPIEGAQRLHAAGQLGPAAGVMESERLTDPTAHLGPAGGARLEPAGPAADSSRRGWRVWKQPDFARACPRNGTRQGTKVESYFMGQRQPAGAERH